MSVVFFLLNIFSLLFSAEGVLERMEIPSRIGRFSSLLELRSKTPQNPAAP